MSTSNAPRKRRWTDAHFEGADRNKKRPKHEQKRATNTQMQDNDDDNNNSHNNHDNNNNNDMNMDDEYANDEQLMKLIDEAPEIAILDGNGLRSLMHELHACMTKNIEQRAKFADIPARFMQSELELNNAIQNVSMQLPPNPRLYCAFVASNGVSHLIQLLEHPNIDIVTNVIGLLRELTEADNYANTDTNTNTDNHNDPSKAIALPIEFVQQNGIAVLMESMDRLNDPNIQIPDELKQKTKNKKKKKKKKKSKWNVLVNDDIDVDVVVDEDGEENDDDNDDGDDEEEKVAKEEEEEEEEEEEDDSQTIFAILSILENLSEIESGLLCAAIVTQCKLFRVLFTLMRKKQQFGVTFMDEIQLYCSELLCIYLQTMDDRNVIFSRFADIRGVDKLLDLLQHKYCESDPSNSEEKEYVSNLLDSLITSLVSQQNQKQMQTSPNAWHKLITLIKAKNFTKQGAIKAFNYAITNNRGNCMKCIEMGGLKTVFGLFMKKKSVKKKYKHEHSQDVMDEHIICIIVQFFCNLSDIPLLRLHSKFLEKDFEKIDRMIELYVKYFNRLEEKDWIEKRLRVENGLPTETRAERYARRLEQGLFTLQMISLCVAFLYTWKTSAADTAAEQTQTQTQVREQSNVRERIEQVLNQNDMDIQQIQQILTEYAIVTQPDDADPVADADADAAEAAETASNVNDENTLTLGSIANNLVQLMLMSSS